MDAWLTLFIVDDLDTIIKLIEQYPEFKKIYEEAYDICCNMEEVMAMFSRELYKLDKNTVQYMIDEMQAIIENSIRNTISGMKKSGLSDEKILDEIVEQYQLSKEQAAKYLNKSN